MLKLVLFISFMMSATAFAEVKKIVLNKEVAVLSRVEKVVTLQKGNTAVRLVQLDNGGSTDMSSAMSPSSLHLTIFQQREDFDSSASFEVMSGMKSFKVLYSDFKEGTIDISVVHTNEEDEDSKMGTFYYRLFVKDAIQATVSGQLKGATVGIQDITPRP